ncbi:MAG: toxin-antitoxin system TumE family protein [Casimicrobiaceae bacterium]
MTRRDASLDALLHLDGQVLVVDIEGQYWVRFVVHRVPVIEGKPHGLDYSLTLHGPDGERLVGFDNAHSIRKRRGAGGGAPIAQDHKHRLRTVRPYAYQDAATLLVDFWNEVDTVLRQKGMLK